VILQRSSGVRRGGRRSSSSASYDSEQSVIGAPFGIDFNALPMALGIGASIVYRGSGTSVQRKEAVKGSKFAFSTRAGSTRTPCCRSKWS
jgi:hypothetical protein